MHSGIYCSSMVYRTAQYSQREVWDKVFTLPTQYSQREVWDKVFTLPTQYSQRSVGQSLHPPHPILYCYSILWLAKWPAHPEGANSCGPGLRPHLYVGSLPVILPKLKGLGWLTQRTRRPLCAYQLVLQSSPEVCQG